MNKLIASIRKNAREQVHVELSEFSPEAGKVFNMVAARLHAPNASTMYAMALPASV